MDILYFDSLNEKKQHGDKALPIELYRVSHEAQGNILPFHWHKEFEFICFISGHAVFTVDDKQYEVKPGDCIFVNSTQVHSGLSTQENSTYYSIVFSPDLLVGDFDECRKYFDLITNNRYKVINYFDSNIHINANIINLLSQIEFELSHKSYAYELEIKSKLFSIFSMIFRNNLITGADNKTNNLHKKKQGMLKDILMYISNNYNKKITLQDIGHTINLSPQYACKLFKELTNSNITTYINNFRIQSSVTLLRDGDMSITDISLDCGFESLSYFNRVFKRQFGCTPSEYRQRVSF